MTGPTGEIYRVDWVPGTDVLHGTCHCGAEHTAKDPIAMWEWMLAHPEGHEAPGKGVGPRASDGGPRGGGPGPRGNRGGSQGDRGGSREGGPAPRRGAS
ncbi:hypothetical protein OG788_36115 [Streptomyces sp. NBC_00647]|uniref:hypothetical protein n=1 Tax=Streptomyces sp. NBC_00647 TaxID=2975796 RepID=UPI0032529159